MAPRPLSAPSRWLLVASALLSLAGLAIAGDLTAIHYRVHTDPDFVSFCAISAELSCDAVAQSDWSVLLGLPISVWGLFGYLLMGALAVWGLGRRSPGRTWPWGLLLLTTSAAVAASAVLAVISKVFIKSMCLMCMASWTVNAALFAIAVLAVRRIGARAAIRQDLTSLRARPGLTAALAAGAACVLGATLGLYPRYWDLGGPVGPGSLRTGTDEQGSPWIGAKAPKLTVEEFSDYECPYCSRAHHNLRGIIAERSSKVRLVHRNFPLDQACNPVVKRPLHVRACERAKAAICAGEQGKFWQMNDLLFLKQREHGLEVKGLAEALKLDLSRFEACLASQEVAERLAADVSEGSRHEMTGTPSYLVGGKKIVGQVSAQEIDRRLAEAGE